MTYVWHVDLPSGAAREVQRDDLDPEAITICLGIIARVVAAPGDAISLPRMPGLSIVGRAGGRCITMAVLADTRLLQTIGIAARSLCGAPTWRSLRDGLPDVPQPRAPWCATLRGPRYGEIVNGDPVLTIMMAALGSVLAWAWLDHLEMQHHAD